ncbi:hypothetical protein BH11MYX2_BH11MYX2_12980 [soil metagenome]
MYTNKAMIFLGELAKDRRFCSASFWPVQGYGQGRTPDAACADLAHGIVEFARFRGFGSDFVVTVTHDNQKTIYLTSRTPDQLLALLLLEQRIQRGLSLADVKEKLGAKSRNAYAQYERGRREPTLSQLTKLLEVVAPSLQLAIIPRNAEVIPPEEELDEQTEKWLAELSKKTRARQRTRSKALRANAATKKTAAKRAA